MSGDPTLDIFFNEATDLLRVFEQGVLGLEVSPADPELLNSVFRAAHTLKGNSAMLGFERVAGFIHILEELLSRLRGGQVTGTPAVVNALLSANDVLRELVAEVRDGQGREIEGLEEVAAALQTFARGAAPPPAASQATPATSVSATPAPAGPRTLYEIRFRPSGALLRLGVRPAGILEALAELGEIIRQDNEPDALPAAAEAEPGRRYTALTCWLMSRAPRAEIEACFEFADEPGAVFIEGLEMDDGPAPIAAGAPSAAGAPAAPGSAAGAWQPGMPDRRRGDRRQGGADADSQSIRVATEKVDRLVNLVGELLITQSMIAQMVDAFDVQALPRLREAVALMDRHSRELQERVMAVRMLPVRTVFARFSRVVRDLAQSFGKRVRFETVGEETELDKTVIERISDPLTHLVRNAVDHGLEAPARRRAAGKEETGRLCLRACQQGGHIYIEVEDDGSGLARDRILARAVDAGLVTAGEGLTDEQVHALLFRPGFSTASQVTEVSGRGVGLDVVRRNVEAVGGSVSIHSVPGCGTTFRIKLPVTLAIVEGQLLHVAGVVYVLPLVAITESVRPTAQTLGQVLGRGEVLMMRGEVLPLVRLHRLFGAHGAVEDPTRSIAVIVEADGRRVALMVDELLGQQQVVIKSLEDNFAPVDGVAGATILGDGRVGLILDVPGLVGLASRRPVPARAA